jgi:hypothetical protein
MYVYEYMTYVCMYVSVRICIVVHASEDSILFN